MLICFDKAERHLPDRCLRQFGMNQTVPGDVLRWERKTRGVDGGIDLSGKMGSELSEWSNRRLDIVEAKEDNDESKYMLWYSKVTRKLVGRPIPMSSEFQRMVNCDQINNSFFNPTLNSLLIIFLSFFIITFSMCTHAYVSLFDTKIL